MTNKRLMNCFKLGSKVTVYVPGTININEEIDNSEYVDSTAKVLSECFGGATSTPARGYWMSSKEGLVKESTTVVFAYANQEDLEKGIDVVVDHCEWLRNTLKQDAVSLEINGEMYFI